MIWTNREEGKVNVLARLKGNGSKRPLLLLNHMDTVPFERSKWSVDPLGAVMKDGYIYGRGALDMKNLGIAQLMTMLELHRNHVELERDILFLAVGDEEAGRFGTAWIDENRRKDIDPEFVLDEGGFGTEGFFTEDGRLIFSVGIAEKRGNSLRLSATGTPGHASMPPEDNANFILAKALGEIARYRTPEIITPITAEMIKRLGGLDRTPYTNAIMRNTISLTIMRGFIGERGKSNVIPETAEAVLDCRLLPGQDPVAFAKQVERVINDPRVDIQHGSGEVRNDVSSFDTDLFRVIEKETKKAYPESITLPHLIIYATDSRYFRRRGATCYGFFPGPVSMAEYKSIHGNDERIRVTSLRAAIPIYYNVVKSFCEVK
jgi:acetylornithine deacetylase/succinyl-diaminopimelate desuccinylase-like protein